MTPRMKFVANALNGNYLESILPGPSDEVDEIYAAIAYGDNSNNERTDLIGNCLAKKCRMDIWMRYDHTVPVAVPLLRRLLRHQKDNIFCKLIPTHFHSKVIWWKGYGAYIGSANLTSNGWVSNIEAGIFIDDGQLQGSGFDLELERFFDELRELAVAFPLSEEVIKEMEELEKLRRDSRDLGQSKLKRPIWSGPVFVGKAKAADRRKENFRKEWSEALSYLANIGSQLSTNRPRWVSEDVPLAWQIDQFLHAYYYNKIGEGNAKPYEEHFTHNKKDPQGALSGALSWWRDTESAPSGEDITFYESAPTIRRYLARDRLLGLSEDEMREVVAMTHATKDHLIKIELKTLGKTDAQYLSREERIPLYVNWLMRQKNSKGWDVKRLLYYVLYEGKDDAMWERIYYSGRNGEYQLSHYGLNSIAELVGWARPEVSPPRNGRTSKALRALGYDVRIY